MVGGGGTPQPGEISLAHNGVLFLDKLPEFNRSILKVLLQPLEDRHITISRARYTLDYPASFMLVAFEKISETAPGESSAAIRERVIAARKVQEERFKDEPGVYCNAQMTTSLLHKYAQPDTQGLNLLKTAMTRLNLSARAYDRILKVSRTIADLEGCKNIQPQHLAEAISYRNLDRDDWAG